MSRFGVLMKKCFKCGLELPLDAFYRHDRMADGRLGKCKDCTKRDVRIRYYSQPEKVREYERKRFCDPDRKRKIAEYQRRSRETHPEKYVARNAVGNAIRDGRLERMPCEVCGDPTSEAHHEDYSKPLEVRWLCWKHHRQIGHGQLVTADGWKR